MIMGERPPPYLIRRKLVIRKHGRVKAVAWEIVLLAPNQNCDTAHGTWFGQM